MGGCACACLQCGRASPCCCRTPVELAVCCWRQSHPPPSCCCRDAKEAAAAAAKEAAAAEAKRGGGGRKQAKNFSLMSFGAQCEGLLLEACSQPLALGGSHCLACLLTRDGAAGWGEACAADDADCVLPLPPRRQCAGEEAEEEDEEAAEAAQRIKIKSAHDALEDERLAKEPAAEIDLDR